MQKKAAANINRGVGEKTNDEEEETPIDKQAPTASAIAPFVPYQGKMRKPGTGCLTQINDHLWEGRYSPVWPDGKKHSGNVYAHTREECEEKLAELIVQMKAEIQAIKLSGSTDSIPDGISEKKKMIAAYMRDHPEVTSKNQIARAVQVDKNTVRRYYDEIRREFAQEDAPR